MIKNAAQDGVIIKMSGILQEAHLYIDGAMGTMLQAAGLKAGGAPDAWNIEHPDLVRKVHETYLAAGAQMILSNTFGSNEERARRGKYGAAELAEAGARIAVDAARAAGKGHYAAMDIGPLGVFLEPLGDLTREEAIEIFGVPAKAGAAAGADCILIETMCSLDEAAAAVAAAKKYGGGLPVFCTLSFSERGRLMTGEDIPTVIHGLEEEGVDGIGCNCGIGPDLLLPLVPQFIAETRLPLLMSPNAGLPVYRDGKTCYDVTPEAFSKDMKALRDMGVWALGGCCGTTPAHIQAMVAACRRS